MQVVFGAIGGKGCDPPGLPPPPLLRGVGGILRDHPAKTNLRPRFTFAKWERFCLDLGWAWGILGTAFWGIPGILVVARQQGTPAATKTSICRLKK